VYDLASSGVLPCNKAIGKLLFPREQINAWLANHAEHNVEPLPRRPLVFLGSHDPLLEWALRESRSSLAMLFDGSHDGIQRFCRREGVAAGLHIHDDKKESWNVDAVKLHCAQSPVVLVEWAMRDRGLIISPEQANKLKSLDDIAALTIVPRQAEAGAQILFSQLLSRANVEVESLQFIDAVRSENDVAEAVSSGAAHVGFGLASVARMYNLPFLPLLQERFDLLIDRQAYFDESLQTLWSFCRTARFASKAESLGGYGISHLGRVHFNAEV